MTSRSVMQLEQALTKHGDDLYRLALLLTPHTAQADAAVLHVVRRLVDDPPGVVDESALVRALVASLPPEGRRRRRQPPEWTQPRKLAAEYGRVLLAIAGLPVEQRLMLGLTHLRLYDHAQLAELLELPEQVVREALRDAVIAIAPQIAGERAAAAMAPEAAEEEHRPTREVLAHGYDLTHAEPAVRGHLALCAECRAVERAWQETHATAGEAIRRALRDVEFPEALADRAQSLIDPSSAQPSLFANVWLWRALVPLAVLLIVALVVFPRAPAPEPEPTGSSNQAFIPPADLVDQALATLYTPPPGEGVWHSRWEMRWYFADGSYAPLAGDLWVDTSSARHRVQLVHTAGGAPYEFELANEDGELWYATTTNYGASLYPLVFDSSYARVRMQLSPDQQQQMLAARLSSGAWALAERYLRLAQATPDLRSWGRQRTDDGRFLDVIGFNTYSLLGLPPDAPDAASSEATILLVIDGTAGRLREIRELIGPPGGEQVGRVIWQHIEDEWVDTPGDLTEIFTFALAWNGIGEFIDQQGVAHPMLPLEPASALQPLVLAVEADAPIWVPTSPPPAAREAVLTSPSFPRDAAVAYFGGGRRVLLRSIARSNIPLALVRGSETLNFDDRTVAMRPLATQGYQVVVTYDHAELGEAYASVLHTRGHTRAEVIAIARSLQPIDIAAYKAQAQLFVSPYDQDPAVLQALIDALDHPLSLDDAGAHQVVERIATRQVTATDPFADPYHLPPYAGWPAEVEVEQWARVVDGVRESALLARDDAGTVYVRSYNDADRAWVYNAPLNVVVLRPEAAGMVVSQRPVSQRTVLRMLVCGANRLETLANGTRAVVYTDEIGSLSCVFERIDPVPDQLVQPVPDLAGITETTVTTWLYIDANGQATRVETRAGAERDGELIRSTELITDTLIPADAVPPDAFDPSPPEALTVLEGSVPRRTVLSLRSVPLTDTLQLQTTPVLHVPDGEDALWGLAQVDTWPQATGLELRDPFSGALGDNFAFRITYRLSFDGPNRALGEPWQIYQGEAERFGAYLRARAIWAGSEPVQLSVDGRQVDGWLVTTLPGSQFYLFEYDGTLVAAQADTTAQRWALERLQPFEPASEPAPASE